VARRPWLRGLLERAVPWKYLARGGVMDRRDVAAAGVLARRHVRLGRRREPDQRRLGARPRCDPRGRQRDAVRRHAGVLGQARGQRSGAPHGRSAQRDLHAGTTTGRAPRLFDAGRRVIGGPAGAGLNRLAARVVDSRLVVDRNRVIQGKGRTASSIAEATPGPGPWDSGPSSFCDGAVRAGRVG
jgi:hypothetical protein